MTSLLYNFHLQPRLFNPRHSQSFRMSAPESLDDILCRHAAPQATNTAPGMMGMEDVIEVAPCTLAAPK
jgi:hypothetical protein